MSLTTSAFDAVLPLRLNPGLVVSTPDDLAMAIVAASNAQAQTTRLRDVEDYVDFQMSCDALNLWRVLLRLQLESSAIDSSAIDAELTSRICETRDYDADEFESAKAATENRVRSPFGLDALQAAYRRSQTRRIRLLPNEVANSEVATAIASIARELQIAVGDDQPILLPIEQLRVLLGRRKTVVSGAVLRLLKAGVIEMLDEKYHTRKAREYKFVGHQGKHFVEVTGG